MKGLARLGAQARVPTRLAWIAAAARREIGALLALAVLAGGAFSFVALAEAVMEGDTHALDEAILLALRTPGNAADPIGPAWFEEAARDITSLGSFPVLFLVIGLAAAYAFLLRKRGAALLMLASVASGTLMITLLKLGFERPRPDLVPHAARVFTASFPSAHATVSAVTYLTLGALVARVQPMRRLKVFTVGAGIALTLLIGASRVYLGVHWPSDVVAGWCVGAAWAVLFWFAARILQRRGQIESDATPAADQEVGRQASAIPADAPADHGGPGR